MPARYDKRILRVLKYIHDNPAGDLSLDTLADVAAMSRFHWHRVFQAMTGETCAEAVRRVRLCRASGWLIDEDWPIAEIAERAGYSNVESFSRAFKAGFGVSPGAFRKQGTPVPLLTLKSKGDFIMHDVRTEDVAECRLAALFHQGAYTELGPHFQKLATIASSLNLWPQIQGVVGVYYDNPGIVEEANLRSHAGLALPEQMPLPDGLQEVRLVAGRYAVLHYKGPYAAIKPAYDYLFGQWLPTSGHEPADAPCYERYLNSPADTASDDLMTEIYLPLAS